MHTCRSAAGAAVLGKYIYVAGKQSQVKCGVDASLLFIASSNFHTRDCVCDGQQISLCMNMRVSYMYVRNWLPEYTQDQICFSAHNLDYE